MERVGYVRILIDTLAAFENPHRIVELGNKGNLRGGHTARCDSKGA